MNTTNVKYYKYFNSFLLLRYWYVLVVFVILVFICAQSAHAAALQSASDTLSTPEPATTATHTIKFSPYTTVPSGGKIVITFSGDANPGATPSATSFAFNDLTSSSIQATNASCSFTISAPSITCTTSASISPATQVTILIGTPSAVLINPSKTKTSGKADVWSARIKTTDGSGTTIDSTFIRVGVVESVEVKARVDQTLIFSIGGIPDNTSINYGNPECTSTETTNSGVGATLNSVTLGNLKNTPTTANTKISNISAQLLQITTNAPGGYVLSATTSSHLQNSAGSFIPDNQTPASFQSGQAYFGVHPCGIDVSPSTWSSGSLSCSTVIGGSTGDVCKYAFPTTTNALTLSSDSTGPVGNDIQSGNGMISVEYAAGIDNNTAAGEYTTTIYYLVTPTF